MTSSLADRAYQEIRAMILDLRLLPGQAILIDELAARLGMSRTPVREAVARLSAGMEGLVTTVPRKGVVVTIPTVEGMREIYEIIEALEGQAVKLAIARADDDLLAALAASVATQEEALARDDLGAWVQSDREFHRLLIVAAGNRRMQELVQLFDGQLHRTRVATIHLRSTPYESTQEHRELLEAIRVRDVERALRIHAEHRARALREMLRVVGDYSGLVLRATLQAAAPPASAASGRSVAGVDAP
jgi:DNA-binding GntR family transcriptional regulator